VRVGRDLTAQTKLLPEPILSRLIALDCALPFVRQIDRITVMYGPLIKNSTEYRWMDSSMIIIIMEWFFGSQ